MRVKADNRLCSGHARCAAVGPQLFLLDDDGYTAISEIDVPPELEALARRGVRACPERALMILDDIESA